jgi:hypothetical protein
MPAVDRDEAVTEQFIEGAMLAYNEVWASWKNLDASNVEQCRRAALTAAFASAAEPYKREIERLKALLREHHDWHLQSGTIGLKDYEGGWVEIDNAIEYADSTMYERTEQALLGMPVEQEPMPRGGVQTWWWRAWVLECRARKKVEKERDAAISEAVKQEREACAQAAEGFPHNRGWVPGSLYDTLRHEVAATIRARGEP